jgi:hypothetical protein
VASAAASGEARLEIPGKVPPSLNVVGGRPHAGAYRRFKKLWSGLFTEQLLAAQAAGQIPAQQMDFVEAAAVIRFAVARDRDEGNFRATLEKALGDALVGDRAAWPEGRWLPDDTAQHFRFDHVAFVVEAGKPPKTVVGIEWSKARLL